MNIAGAKIVSDGTPTGTAVFVDGVPLKGVTKIEILPIVPDKPIKAKITLFVGVDVKVNGDNVELCN